MVSSDPAELAEAALRRVSAASWDAGARNPRTTRELVAILKAPDDVRREAVTLFVMDISQYLDDEIFAALFRGIRLTGEQLQRLVESHAARTADDGANVRRWTIRRIAPYLAETFNALSDEERRAAVPFLQRLVSDAHDRATAARLSELVAPYSTGLPLYLISDGDSVGPRLRAAFESSTEPESALAAALALLADFPDKGRPNRTWLARADAVLQALSDPVALPRALLDAALDAPDTVTVYEENPTEAITRYINAGNEAMLCAAAVLAGTLRDPAVLPSLRRLAVKTATFVGGQHGVPRSLRLANSCAAAIADIGADASVGELLALERAVRHGALLKQVRKAIDSLAATRGLSREELLERAVEEHGLDAAGARTVALSRGSAFIRVDARTVALSYLDEAGVGKKAFPASVQDADRDVLAALKQDVKAIRKTLAGERHRLDRLLASDRQWELAEWRRLYLAHPITGRLARSTIWGFRTADGSDVVGIPIDDATAMTGSGDTVEVRPDATVRLWHPIEAATEAVLSWRTYLLHQEIVQPIKQAFREVYVLTPAEAQTRIYSNRFAGHVFRQEQARALMKSRGWQPDSLASREYEVDSGVARRDALPHGIRAEFFYDAIVDYEPEGSLLYPLCTSDQVRFFQRDDDGPMQLAEVPPVVFTETMRDVDLFIGVTSVGADPEWLDRGEDRAFDAYWQAFNFGQLTATAQVRREVLAHLLPRLAIADRCMLDEQFVTVRGNLRTYRIHMGSGNVLMSPNDQYLCIVAARDSRADRLYLPFDDDPVLSLVLSKIFMLANDTAISDRTITDQIRGHNAF